MFLCSPYQMVNAKRSKEKLSDFKKIFPLANCVTAVERVNFLAVNPLNTASFEVLRC